ncbi:hypothetical protein [Rossellomorea vietnamensis]|uniref:hypothetical protein n=1 Tax=Rossellomorea vietnamensis TaxID=218284 RepID=UPI00077CB1E9|nr:hypothetical protein [Rossellomorea vietnamensis]
MSRVASIDFQLKSLAESKKLEKERIGWLDSEIKLTPASFQRIKPTDAKPDETFYKFYFHSKPTKNYFVARKLAEKARLHKILNNEFYDDETINHLAIFSSKQKNEILMMDDLLGSSGLNIGLYGYAIYGVHLYSIMTHCKERLEGSYLRYDDMAHFMGCMTQREKNDREIAIAQNVGRLLKERYVFSKGIELGHYIRFKYMYGMHKNYLEMTRYIEEIIEKIPGSKTRTDRFIETYKEKSQRRKDEINRIYTELIENGEITARWASEWALYSLIKKKYPDAIYQYRDKWLGNQSLDIYVPSQKLAFEYQGIQHFEPVNFFGGEQAFNHRVYLDERKKKKAEAEKIKIIYWDYNEPISVNILKEKLRES